MERPCDYNQAIICDSAECYHCGWDPKVAKARQDALTEGRYMDQKLYKVNFLGYCEVWAKSPEDALEKAEDLDQQFFAHYEYSKPICLSKEENDELD